MNRSAAAKPIYAVDLFAGAGGLSAGAASAGIVVTAAVEIDADAAKTYTSNHHGVTTLVRDVREVSGKELQKTVPGRLHILMGCAPCQGFCSLTSKHDRIDPRNQLILEMARLVEESKPEAVFMENVPGLLQKGRSLFNRFVSRLTAAGYNCAWDVIQMADFGVPQNRKRLVFFAARSFMPVLPTPTHSKTSSTEKKPWVTVRQAISGMAFPKPLAKEGRGTISDWNLVRNLKPETRARLRAALPGKTRLEIDSRLLPDCHQDGYDGFRNVYTRMSWDKISPTITAGCTTPAKGRFGHPDRRRTTISVLEAALLQTFPATYKFNTRSIDSACQMIGNAVPPAFARIALGSLRSQILDRGAKA